MQDKTKENKTKENQKENIQNKKLYEEWEYKRDCYYSLATKVHLMHAIQLLI